MKLKIPKNLASLTKDELIELVENLVAKLDNCVVEEEREKELKPKSRCGGCCKSK